MLDTEHYLHNSVIILIIKLHNTRTEKQIDPCSAAAFPLAAVRALPNVALLLTVHGGHIAFLEGLFPRGESYMDRLLGQFVEAVFEHPREINQACGVKGLGG